MLNLDISCKVHELSWGYYAQPWSLLQSSWIFRGAVVDIDISCKIHELPSWKVHELWSKLLFRMGQWSILIFHAKYMNYLLGTILNLDIAGKVHELLSSDYARFWFLFVWFEVFSSQQQGSCQDSPQSWYLMQHTWIFQWTKVNIDNPCNVQCW